MHGDCSMVTTSHIFLLGYTLSLATFALSSAVAEQTEAQEIAFYKKFHEEWKAANRAAGTPDSNAALVPQMKADLNDAVRNYNSAVYDYNRMIQNTDIDLSTEIEKAARRVRVEKAKVGFAKEALAICNLPVLNFLTLRRR